jgi:hypothetical protein
LLNVNAGREPKVLSRRTNVMPRTSPEVWHDAMLTELERTACRHWPEGQPDWSNCGPEAGPGAAPPFIPAIMPQSRAPWRRQAKGINCCGGAKASSAADGSNMFNKHRTNKTAARQSRGSRPILVGEAADLAPGSSGGPKVQLKPRIELLNSLDYW